MATQPGSGEVTAMMARLGNVIYWIACGVAIIAFVMVISPIQHVPPDDRVYTVIAAVVVAAIIWAIGRAVQYIFGGGNEQ